MNLFLFLTAMLSALAGVGRPATGRPAAAVEASQVMGAVQIVAPAAQQAIASRPDGYVAPRPLQVDLRIALAAIRPVAPERRRL